MIDITIFKCIINRKYINYTGTEFYICLTFHIRKSIIKEFIHLYKNRETFDFVGPVHLYEKCGFTKEAQQEDRILMRKVL